MPARDEAHRRPAVRRRDLRNALFDLQHGPVRGHDAWTTRRQRRNEAAHAGFACRDSIRRFRARLDEGSQKWPAALSATRRTGARTSDRARGRTFARYDAVAKSE